MLFGTRTTAPQGTPLPLVSSRSLFGANEAVRGNSEVSQKPGMDTSRVAHRKSQVGQGSW